MSSVQAAEMMMTYFYIPAKNKGFTLLELAFVLLIIGMMMGGLMTAIGQSAENTNRLEARNKLREIEEALYGFAQVQGRLPCPADADTNGLEDVANVTNGTCNLFYGLLPNATLGLSGPVNADGLLEDPWGNPYRYSVANTTANGSRYTGTSGITSIYNNAATQVGTSLGFLNVCDIDDCTGVYLSAITPAVVLTMGKNWPEIATASDNEQENASGTTLGGTYAVSDTRNFVLTGYSEENFDDLVIWISPHLLFSKLITAGKLP